MTIKAVILDIDGTLVNFTLDYKTSRAEVTIPYQTRLSSIAVLHERKHL